MQTKMLKYGVEVEGEFSRNLIKELSLLDGVNVGTDGSVSLCGSASSEGFNHSDFTTQEVRTDPLSIDRIRTTAKQFFGVLGEWGKDFHSNSSAGFHIHISFDPKEPPELMSAVFFKSFLEAVKENFPKEYEARHNNRFCIFEGLDSADNIDLKIRDGNMKNGVRYRAINLTALNKHGTIEFRLWPSNKPKKMLSYLLFTVDFIQAYLDKEHRFVQSITKRSTMRKIKRINLI